jgi:hypothetical protein
MRNGDHLKGQGYIEMLTKVDKEFHIVDTEAAVAIYRCILSLVVILTFFSLALR